MFGRTGATWALAASAFWLSACGRANDAETNADFPQITLHVPGMIDRQGIT
jgi:hypothetical protein